MDAQRGEHGGNFAAEDLLLAFDPVLEQLRDLVDRAATRLHASCALTVRGDRQGCTAATSDTRAELMSEWQHDHGTGPDLDAIRGGIPAFFGYRTASQWPDYARFATEHLVTWSMSMPLLTEAATVGALTAYRELPDGCFTPAHVEVAQRLAAYGAGAVALILRIARDPELSEAMAERSVIDTAVGILILRTGDDRAHAMAALRADATAHSVDVAAAADDGVLAVSTQ